MDLMIEAKDKEQAVFELRRKWDVEGGVPAEWILRGEKMDEEREVPTYEGEKVFYEEGQEWRFKPPIKMPVKVSKVLEKLEKERLKVEGRRVKIGDKEGELESIEIEIVRIEEERRKVLEDWEREKRIKWGLEKTVDDQGNDITPVSPPKRKSKAKKKAVVKDEEEEKEGDDMMEDTPATVAPRLTPNRAATVRGRKNYTEIEEEGSEDYHPTGEMVSPEEHLKKPKGRGRRKPSEMDPEIGDTPAIVPQMNGAASSSSQNVGAGGKKRKRANGVKRSVEKAETATETIVGGTKKLARSRKL